MKHVTFTVSEAVLAIARLRNYVFPADDDVIIVDHADWFTRICGLLKDLHIHFWTYKNQIHLTNGYYILIDKANLDEFYISKGKDEMEILSEEQYYERLYL